MLAKVGFVTQAASSRVGSRAGRDDITRQTKEPVAALSVDLGWPSIRAGHRDGVTVLSSGSSRGGGHSR